MDIHKIIVVTVGSGVRDEGDMFLNAVPKALREYTNEVEKGQYYNGYEKFKTSNGCTVRSVVALPSEIKQPCIDFPGDAEEPNKDVSLCKEIAELRKRIEELEFLHDSQLFER